MGMDSIAIDINLLWRSWRSFRRGKRLTPELEKFEYHIEDELGWLYRDISNKSYTHGQYRHFTVNDNKPRMIAVPELTDRIVHRLVYDYLVEVFDRTFIYDVWSCRTGKGLLAAIDRSSQLFQRFHGSYVWRTDIAKYFDSVDHEVLKSLIRFRVSDPTVLWLVDEIIDSYQSAGSVGRGIPLGNLTSQIFGNIYFNEFDRFVAHELHPQAYVRYGDDFIILGKSRDIVEEMQMRSIDFLTSRLKLTINKKHDILIPVRHGIHFLGVDIFPTGRRLRSPVWRKVLQRVSLRNIGSYRGLLYQHNVHKRKIFNWHIYSLCHSKK